MPVPITANHPTIQWADQYVSEFTDLRTMRIMHRMGMDTIDNHHAVTDQVAAHSPEYLPEWNSEWASDVSMLLSACARIADRMAVVQLSLHQES